MKSIKQRLIDEELSLGNACIGYYNDLTQEDVDYIVKRGPEYAAEFLNEHPLLTKEHFDCMVEEVVLIYIEYLKHHTFFTQKHVDYIVEKNTKYAIRYLSHRFSEENIKYIAQNHPKHLKEIFK